MSSAPPSARAIPERAPLMQSMHTSRPLSSMSCSGSTGRPQTAQLDSSDGRSSSDGAARSAGGGSPTNVIADTLLPDTDPPGWPPNPALPCGCCPAPAPPGPPGLALATSFNPLPHPGHFTICPAAPGGTSICVPQVGHLIILAILLSPFCYRLLENRTK